MFKQYGMNNIKCDNLWIASYGNNDAIAEAWEKPNIGTDYNAWQYTSTARIDGIKPDKKGFSYSDAVSVSGNIVTVTTKQQMTIVSGTVVCEIRFINAGNTIGTLNFKMEVEPSPVNENTDISETDLPDVIDAATSHMLNAEAWAKGTKNGVAVDSTAPQYHNNSKYWSDSSANSASESANSANASNNSATASESWAIGGTNTRTGENTNNSKYWSQQAQSAVEDTRKLMLLESDNIPNTTQTLVYGSDGNISTVYHKNSSNVAIRTDVFTFGTSSITEVRTLNTGDSLTIVTNTNTYATTVTYSAA
jgi:hypothetical protein